MLSNSSNVDNFETQFRVLEGQLYDKIITPEEYLELFRRLAYNTVTNKNNSHDKLTSE